MMDDLEALVAICKQNHSKATLVKGPALERYRCFDQLRTCTNEVKRDRLQGLQWVPATPRSERYSPAMKVFQPFRLDTVNHCLWRAEERLRLTHRTFDVLPSLVEHAERLVTQDEILEALWPETYVNPEVIKQYIRGIRKALGDDPEKPSYIETFPTRGYQFIAPVSDESAASSPSFSPKGIVGRKTALAELGACLASALRGQRQLVFVTGEAGIGKTTLVEAFHQQATRRPNLRLARGQCIEGFGGKEAYYPMLEALGQLVRHSHGSRVPQTLPNFAPTSL